MFRKGRPPMIEEIVLDGVLQALIVRRDYHVPGIHFFTPHDFSQQLGYMAHPAGHRILPHTHLQVQRQVRLTQEVLVLRKGRLRVDFYGQGRVCLRSCTLESGDVILLASGGHGFQVLDDCEMLEIKPGPFVEGQDKVRFTPLKSGTGNES
jgi:hypothetical protein